MKRILGGLAAALLTLAIITPVATATPSPDLHCPAGGVKVEANGGTQAAINSLVLPAGTQFCVKAGPGNTGILTADGQQTLQDYSPDEKDVSYYVVYGGQPSATPTPTPEPTPEPTPTVEPSPTPTVTPEPSSTPTFTPSPTPSVEPTPTPTPSETPTSTPTPTTTPTSEPSPSTTPEPRFTLPPTDTEPSESSTGSDPGMVGWLVLALAAAIGLYAMTRRLKTAK